MSRLVKNKLLTFAVILVAIQLILAIGAPLFAPYDPMAQSVARRLRGPTELNWLGTDQLGRDVLTYCSRMDAARHEALQGMADLDQEAGLFDDHAPLDRP